MSNSLKALIESENVRISEIGYKPSSSSKKNGTRSYSITIRITERKDAKSKWVTNAWQLLSDYAKSNGIALNVPLLNGKETFKRLSQFSNWYHSINDSLNPIKINPSLDGGLVIPFVFNVSKRIDAILMTECEKVKEEMDKEKIARELEQKKEAASKAKKQKKEEIKASSTAKK